MFIQNIVHNIKVCNVLIMISICGCLTFSCKSLDLEKSKAIAGKNNSYNDNDEDDSIDDNNSSIHNDDSSNDNDAVCVGLSGSVDSDICEIEHIIIKQLNEYRSSRGLSTLKSNKALSCAARAHAEDQASRGRIGHWGFNPGLWGGQSDREKTVESCGSDSSEVSNLTYENTGMYPSSSSNESTATNFMNMWKRSPGHNQNMLNNNSTYIGVGVAKSGSYYYGTQVFGQ